MSLSRATLRPLPELRFPESLPVSQLRDQLVMAIRDHPVVIVCGETGSGKTTQLPKICALAGCGQRGLIGHTQPRRLAATTVAKRISEELATPLGMHVGYKIRFNERFSAGATIKLMTDGILLAETQADPLLSAYDTIIVDEAHERSLNIDFLLGYLKQLIAGQRQGQLKLVITSATIDAQRFAEHFGNAGKPAPVVEVSGRLYPVDIRYRAPLDLIDNGRDGTRHSNRDNNRDNNRDEDDETDLPSQIEDTIAELWRERPGDVLVFLPGEREIRDTADHLRRAIARAAGGRAASVFSHSVEVLPLFSRLSAADQDRVFSIGSGRRIVLATNVAETSLTVPGIRYVIDSGVARVKRYRYRSRVEQLQIEPISQAAANQRAGRCGRVSDGVCVRLYSEEDYNGRPRFTDPEVLRSSLAAVILRMKALHLPSIEEFPFLDPPPRKAITEGYSVLHELNAVDEQGALTDIGRVLSRLPVDPKVGRMLLAAHDSHSLREVLVIAAALTSQDPRERPSTAQQAADQQHKRFADEQSDFVSLLKLWDYWQGAIDGREASGESNRRLTQRLEREFLSARKLREWADVHSQLVEAAGEMRWRSNASPATYEQIHLALLSGLLGNMGTKPPEDASYAGTNGVKFVIHPSSSLTRKAPRWLMAAELVDTGRLYARTVAKVEPQWIERTAAHLLARSWSDPVWSKNAGQLVAMERGVLYGLAIYAQRRVHFGSRDPRQSRERLIRDGLIDGDLEAQAQLPFIERNRRLIAEIEKLEQKIRRPELLVNENFLFDWFDARLPAEVWSVDLMARWYREARRGQANLLVLSRDDLLRKDSERVSSNDFPKVLASKGLELELDYRFEPGSSGDGVTATLPLHALNQVDVVAIEWLVPGMLRDKVQALIKSLPQKLRRHLVPLPEYAEQFCQLHAPAAKLRPLLDVLIDDIAARASVRPQISDFKLEQVPVHLFMNLRLVDGHRSVIALSRNLSQLKIEHGARAQTAFQAAFAAMSDLTRDPQRDPQRGPERDPQREAQHESTCAPSPAADNTAVIPKLQNASDTTAVGNAIGGRAVEHEAQRSVQSLPAGSRYQRWEFGSLPEILELKHGSGRNSDSLIGYPALLDLGDAVELKVYDQLEVAQRIHRQGLQRLFALELKEPLRFFSKNIPQFVELSLLYGKLGSAEQLRDELIRATINRSCMAEPLPQDATMFAARIEQARPRLNLVGQEVVRASAAVLLEYAQAVRKLASAKPHAASYRDIDEQLQALIQRQFITATPANQIAHLPRYLKAIVARIDKLRADPARDQQRMQSMAALQQGYRGKRVKAAGQRDPHLEEFGWLLEELRVSLFAQELRTPMPVSVKRLEKAWAQIVALS